MSFSLLVYLGTQKTDWDKLNQELKSKSSEGIEVFPIPQFLDMPRDYLGVSIINSVYSEEKIFIIKIFITYLLQEGYKVFELYNSNEFTVENTDLLISKFFPTLPQK